MTIPSTRPTRPRNMAEDDWGRAVYNRHHSGSSTPGGTLQEPAEWRGAGAYVVAFLMLLALVVLCVTALLLVRVLLPDRSPALLPTFVTWTPSPGPFGPGAQPTASPTGPGTSDQAVISVDPAQGTINTLVTVTGQGWWPGEPVFVFLRSPQEGNGRGYSYAAAVADDRGKIRTALTFPNEMRWIGQEWADVIGRGTRSGKEASTRFILTTPTSTNTLPPPTAQPTLAPTSTPLPTPTPLPTDTPLPTPTPEVIITDWRGEYFANPALSGDPILVRNDGSLDMNWGADPPDWGIPADGFSARWTQWVYFDAGSYRFAAMADDGVRFWIDGQLVLDEWHDSTQETYLADVSLLAGEHSLVVEYYENLGGARIYLNWAQLEPPTPAPSPALTEPPTSIPEPTVPLTPTSTLPPPPSAEWRGEYFDNPSLEGEPVLIQADPAVDFDWGVGSPGEGVPADDFSARWTRQIWVPAGTYRYFLEADDGARLWVDGELLINAWPATIGSVYTVETPVSDGIHILRIEYFEITVDARIHFWSEAVR